MAQSIFGMLSSGLVPIEVLGPNVHSQLHTFIGEITYLSEQYLLYKFREKYYSKLI